MSRMILTSAQPIIMSRLSHLQPVDILSSEAGTQEWEGPKERIVVFRSLNVPQELDLDLLANR